MSEEKRVLELDKYEHKAIANILFEKRTTLIEENKDKDFIDEKGKFHLNDTGLVTYSHGEYFLLGEKLGKFGYSVQKKSKKGTR